VAYIRSWKLALALTSIFPCLVITGGIMNKLMSKWIQLSLGHVAAGGTLAEEVISTIRTAQAFGSQKTLSKLYNTHILAAQTVDMKSAIVHGAGIGTFFFVIYCAYALAFDFGTTLILRGEANAGVVVNVFMAVLIGSFSLVLLAPEMQAITQGRGAAAKLYATIDRVPDIDSLSKEGVKLVPEEVRGEIEFKEVMFNYPSRPTVQILKGLSLKFKAGQTVALVGASGSGKSTIVSLVERFYDPLNGQITLDGHDLRTLNLTSLRSQIGLVSQEPVLFATSIFGNVAHGLIGSPFENVGEEEKERLVKEACVKANADGFVSKLPNGYGTLVGERGFLLSGGQKRKCLPSLPSSLLLFSPPIRLE
jgi:ATP-binding cassette subfamily B (MDR/TAP) protein 1